MCDLARKGIEVERSSRTVQIFSITVEELCLPLVKMRVHCSKGTYIRTLCHDIGKRLGCGGAMESLVRTRVADFRLMESFSLDEVERRVGEKGDSRNLSEKLGGMLIPVDRLFDRYPAVRVTGIGDRLLANGNKLELSMLQQCVFPMMKYRQKLCRNSSCCECTERMDSLPDFISGRRKKSSLTRCF